VGFAPVTARSCLRALPPDRDPFEELFAWTTSTVQPLRAILDVGGGGTLYDFTSRLRPVAERIVGVDPDPSVCERPWFDEAHVLTAEQYAVRAVDAEPREQFDLALCLYVLEHIDQPSGFLSAIRSLLRPGGACFGATPNLWHYFGLASMLSSRAHVEDWVLHRLRPPELIDAYHCPVRYRINSVRALTAGALRAGFESVEVRALDQVDAFETYFPERWRWFPRGYSRMVNRLGRPSLYGTLLFRLGC
jgi:SAM-dependent methyltransferase